MPEPTILRVGDRAHVAGRGFRRVERIDIALTPSTDPAAEDNYARVELVELGEHSPSFVVGLEDDSWAYGAQLSAEGIEAGEE